MNRSGQRYGTANGRIQRVPLHLKTTTIEPERDRLGRRSPGMLTAEARAQRDLDRRAHAEAASQVYRGQYIPK